MAEMVAGGLIGSCLDYANCVLYDITQESKHWDKRL